MSPPIFAKTWIYSLYARLQEQIQLIGRKPRSGWRSVLKTTPSARILLVMDLAGQVFMLSAWSLSSEYLEWLQISFVAPVQRFCYDFHISFQFVCLPSVPGVVTKSVPKWYWRRYRSARLLDVRELNGEASIRLIETSSFAPWEAYMTLSHRVSNISYPFIWSRKKRMLQIHSVPIPFGLLNIYVNYLHHLVHFS